MGASDVARKNAERVKRLEEAPPDSLRWNPNDSNRNFLAQQRRRAVALAEQETAEAEMKRLAVEEQRRRPPSDDELVASRAKHEVRDTLREQPRALNANARRLEEQRQVRAMLAEEKQRATAMEMQHARQAAALDDALRRGDSDLAGVAGRLQDGGGLGSGLVGKNASARHLLSNPDRVAALSDPRVQKALDAALNQPNALAMQQYKTRNTTRVSAERKF